MKNHTVTTAKSVYRRRGDAFIFGQRNGFVDFAIGPGPVPKSWKVMVKEPHDDGKHFMTIMMPRAGGRHTALRALRTVIADVKQAGGVAHLIGAIEKDLSQPTIH